MLSVSTIKPNPLFCSCICLMWVSLMAGIFTSQVSVASDTSPLIQQVVVYPIKPPGHFFIQRRFVGRIEADQITDLGFELAGRISDLKVDEGDWVEKGQLIAMLDQNRLQGRRDQAKAALDQAKAELALANATFERTQAARSINAVSQQSVDEALQNTQARKAQLAQAQVGLTLAVIELEKSQLKAPFSGQVVQRLVDLGQVMQPGQRVFQLETQTPLKARVRVHQDFAAEIAPGDTLQLEVGTDEKKRRVTAQLSHQLRRLDAQQQTQLLILGFTEPQALLPGTLVVLPLKRRVPQTGFSVPITALAEGIRGLWALYVLRPKNDGSATQDVREIYALEKRLVTLLVTNDSHALVRGRLNPGELIVAQGLHKVVPGMQVTVAPVE